MSNIHISRSAPGSLGTNITNRPLEIKRVQAGSTSVASSESVAEDTATQGAITSERVSDTQASESPVVEESAAERRAKRKDEYREAALIRERALTMQKQAEQQIKETQQFASLMAQAKEDPTVLAKALNMDPAEFQRKMFNKMYSIKEEPVPEKEETFEEQTKRKLEQYEHERAQDKEHQMQEARQYAEVSAQRIKATYIQNDILPAISEDHEFILANGKENCAQMIYDFMNSIYRAEAEKAAAAGKQFYTEDFNLQPIDVINEMEEDLCRQSEEQLLKAKNIKKLRKHFAEESEEYSIQKKDYGSSPVQRRVQSTPSPTLSNSLGSSAPPAAVSSISSGPSNVRKIPLGNRNARREAAKRNLGQ